MMLLRNKFIVLLEH